ncbi:unnamed protein product [Larinioides sclopetarius]|uniref:Uncharacterized protein n=1 Tax=Larinioides sclopetarius TaxID=280406 RepID=A0AAV1Z8X3_9ARAC
MEWNPINQNDERIPRPPEYFDDEDLLLYFIGRYYKIIAILIKGTWNAYKIIFNKISWSNVMDFIKEFICMILFAFYILSSETFFFMKSCIPLLNEKIISLLKLCFCYSSLIKVTNWLLYLGLIFIMISRVFFVRILTNIREVINFRNRWLRLFDIVSHNEVNGSLGRFWEVIEPFEENSSTNPVNMIFVYKLLDLCRSCLKLIWTKVFFEVTWRVAFHAHGFYKRIGNFVVTAYNIDKEDF